MRFDRLFVVVLGSFLFLFSIYPVIAQTKSTATIHGTLHGTLTDSSGAVVTGAEIAAQPINSSGALVTAKSDSEGTFSLSLLPGRYRVSVEHMSFTRVEQDFTLSSNELRTWNVRLELERLSANVVVTAATEPATVDKTVAPVYVISREEIDQRQEIFLTPVLASVPGASFSQLGPMGGSTTFFLDGGNSNYTKVLIDGVPTNQPGGLVDFSNFTLDSIDKIEVVHGASSALYGSDAVSGVVQIFTHRGTTRTPELMLEGDGGTFGTGHGTGQLSGLLGAFDYSAGAAYFSSDGQGPDNFLRDTTLSGNFGWRFSDTNSLRLTLRNNSSDAGQPGQTLLPGQSNFGQSTGLHDFSAGLSWDFTTGSQWQHRLSAFESRTQSLDVVPPFGSFASKFNRTGINEQSTYLFHNGGVTAGYEYEKENGGATGRQNQAGYLEAHYNFSQRFTVLAGGRVEDNGFFGMSAVPRAGVAYALRHGHGFLGSTRLRASYGLGIKEPEILPSSCSPQLAPERSRTVDAGFDQVLASDRIHLSVTYFNNSFHDIVSFAFGGSSPNCPAFGGSFFNTDLARAYGTNSTIEMKPFKWLNVVGNYTYDDSRVLKTTNPLMDPALAAGNRLFKRPLNSANLITNVHVRQVNFNFAGYYVGRRTDSDFDGMGFTSDPGYVRWDTAINLPLRHKLSAVAQVQNLFDRRYSDAIGYPVLGRNYRLGMKYVWGGER